MIENHVANFELSTRLHELGVMKDSIFSWFPAFISGDGLSSRHHELRMSCERAKVQLPCVYRAYTASELLGMLPSFVINNEDYFWFRIGKIFTIDGDLYTIYYKRYEEILFDHIEDKNICNALAKMLIYLIENKLVDVNQINQGENT